MTVAFPVPLDDFFATLDVVAATFYLGDAGNVSRTAGGEVFEVANGPRLWQGTVSVRPRTVAAADRQMARTEILRRAGASFIISPHYRRGPQDDWTGATLGAAQPTISGLRPDNLSLDITNLPVGYTIKRGDFLSFGYGSNPTRYALHRSLRDGVAGSNGNIFDLEMTSFIRPGANVGADITLVRPFCKAKMLPGSLRPYTISGRIARGFSFDWVQTLR